jgi:hypothetical protein
MESLSATTYATLLVPSLSLVDNLTPSIWSIRWDTPGLLNTDLDGPIAKPDGVTYSHRLAGYRHRLS